MLSFPGADMGERPQDRQQHDKRARRNAGEQAGISVSVEGTPLSGARERIL
jgi:hypothetical protein